MNIDKPNFKHDCKNCTFLGAVLAGGQIVDLYFCPKIIEIPTVIARYSSKGDDYSSGLNSIAAELIVAEFRARAARLLPIVKNQTHQSLGRLWRNHPQVIQFQSQSNQTEKTLVERIKEKLKSMSFNSFHKS